MGLAQIELVQAQLELIPSQLVEFKSLLRQLQVCEVGFEPNRVCEPIRELVIFLYFLLYGCSSILSY